MGYVLDHIVKDIYLTNKPIDNDLRVKLNILNIVLDTDIEYTIDYNIFSLKRRYYQETYKYSKEECKEKIEELKVKIREAVKKFYNY